MRSLTSVGSAKLRWIAAGLVAAALSPLLLAAASVIAPEAHAAGYRVAIEPEDSQADGDRAAETLRRRFDNNSFALVIGISRFGSRAWRTLPGVPKEIQEVRRALEVQGFKVVSDSNESGTDGQMEVTSRQLRERIDRFLVTYGHKPDTRLVIYVATHGYAKADEAKNETQGYLVTSDSPESSDDRFASNAYSVQDLSQQLSKVEARHVFLFFNACFSGSMVPAYPNRSQQPDVIAGLDRSTSEWASLLMDHKARLVLTAGGADQEVPDVDNPFSKAVVDGLLGAADEDGDGLIRGLELASYVTGRVARETYRRGLQNSPIFAKFDDDRAGDYVFVSPRGARADKAPDAQRTDLAKMQATLATKSLFVECRDCPVMVEPPVMRNSSASVENIPEKFAIAQTETTFNQWDACFRDLYCRSWIDDGGRGRGNNPVSGLTWQDAQDFALWLNRQKAESADIRCDKYRLPTVGEWVYAARANKTTRFPWGDDLGRDNIHCWNCDSRFDRTRPAPAASFPENGFGIYDMLGNVWEWVDATDDRCESELLSKDRCSKDGVVMGGAFSTRFSSADSDPISRKGYVPRTSSRPKAAFRLSSVGMRIACTLRPKQ